MKAKVNTGEWVHTVCVPDIITLNGLDAKAKAPPVG